MQDLAIWITWWDIRMPLSPRPRNEHEQHTVGTKIINLTLHHSKKSCENKSQSIRINTRMKQKVITWIKQRWNWYKNLIMVSAIQNIFMYITLCLIKNSKKHPWLNIFMYIHLYVYTYIYHCNLSNWGNHWISWKKTREKLIHNSVRKV